MGTNGHLGLHCSTRDDSGVYFVGRGSEQNSAEVQDWFFQNWTHLVDRASFCDYRD